MNDKQKERLKYYIRQREDTLRACGITLEVLNKFKHHKRMNAKFCTALKDTLKKEFNVNFIVSFEPFMDSKILEFSMFRKQPDHNGSQFISLIRLYDIKDWDSLQTRIIERVKNEQKHLEHTKKALKDVGKDRRNMQKLIDMLTRKKGTFTGYDFNSDLARAITQLESSVK